EPAERLSGLDGLREAIAILDGYELASTAWERDVLPARVADYDPAMIDLLCLAGEVGWARLAPAQAEPAAVAPLAPATPIAIFPRDHAAAWHALGAADRTIECALGDASRLVLETLRSRGASFFGELTGACPLDADALRDALGSLVAAGLAASDGFSGLRALVATARGGRPVEDRRTTFAGRWSALPGGADRGEAREAALETQARTLLRRYGVVFRRLLTREANAAPWRDLARVYRRLEARGEIRGGRFVAGMSGEQFALPAAVQRLREIRRTPPNGR